MSAPEVNSKRKHLFCKSSPKVSLEACWGGGGTEEGPGGDEGPPVPPSSARASSCLPSSPRYLSGQAGHAAASGRPLRESLPSRGQLPSLFRTLTWGPGLRSTWALSCVTTPKELNFSEPLFPHLENGPNAIPCLVGLPRASLVAQLVKNLPAMQEA